MAGLAAKIPAAKVTTHKGTSHDRFKLWFPIHVEYKTKRNGGENIQIFLFYYRVKCHALQ